MAKMKELLLREVELKGEILSKQRELSEVQAQLEAIRIVNSDKVEITMEWEDDLDNFVAS